MIRGSCIKIKFAAILLLVVSVSLFSQSSYTRHGQNSVLFDLHTALDTDGVMEEGGFRIGMSIGGILDLGADFSIAHDDVESEDSTETNIGIRYGVMVLKQENRSPVSLSLGGTYGYAFVESDYYSDQNLQKEGRGYTLKMELLRDFQLGSNVLLRLGGFGEYRNYNYSILLVAQASEENQEFSSSRETIYKYGAVVSLGIKNSRGRTYYIEGIPSLDEDSDFSVKIRSGMVFNLR